MEKSDCLKDSRKEYSALMFFPIKTMMEEGVLLVYSGGVSDTSFSSVAPEVITFDEQTPESYTFDNIPL